MDTFARDNLPPREQWPTLLELDYPERLNAAVELLDRRWDERPCVLADETWTYAELRSRASAIARMLVDDMGLVPGNRVLLHGYNDPQLIACWFGIRKQTAIGDRQFLRSMIPHHAGAILMCQQASVTDAEIKRLCEGIISSQQREIDQMKARLRQLGS